MGLFFTVMVDGRKFEVRAERAPDALAIVQGYMGDRSFDFTWRAQVTAPYPEPVRPHFGDIIEL
jgi:hypothetical protein